VLVERPFYDPLPAAAQMLGARVGWFERRFEESYDVDPEAVAAALTPKTRLLILSHPHNPSGALVSEGSFAALARLAEKRGIHVLVDEVYLDTVPGEPPTPAALRSERFISTSSLTKAYGLASLRCGWAVASAELAQAIRRARDVVDVWGPMPSDRLSVVAFRNLDRLKERARSIVDANLGAVSAFLSDRPDLEFVPPRATIAFPRLRETPDAGPFVERLWRESRTAVAPGTSSGRLTLPDCLRRRAVPSPYRGHRAMPRRRLTSGTPGLRCPSNPAR
jgi:aspartate/methionine/tyrosine aminotransferase